MSEATVITLQHPITYTADKIDGGGEREVREIHLPSRIKVRHLRAMDEAKGEMAKAAALIASLTGLPRAAIDELDADDLAAVMGALEGPLSQFQGTGLTP